jgi:DNA helicase-2/ATP-dependent DNA helicase PcrA
MIQPSRFIAEIPPPLLQLRSSGGSRSYDFKEQPASRRAFHESGYGGNEKAAAYNRDLGRSGYGRSPRVRSRHTGSYAIPTHDTPDAVKNFLESRQPTLSSPREPEPPRHGPAMKPGTQVLHEKYGVGVVIDREKSGDDFKLTVSFTSSGKKKLIERYAKLKKV